MWARSARPQKCPKCNGYGYILLSDRLIDLKGDRNSKFQVFFAILAHSVPLLQLTLIVIAIVLVFAFIVLVMLLRTGTLSGDAFNQSLEGFWKSIPLLKGQESEKNTDSSPKEPADSEKPKA